MSDDEFDDIPDEFANLHGVDWAQILGPGPSADTFSTHETPETLPSPVPPNLPDSNDSSYFSDDGDMDTDFLAELDRLEETLIAAPSVSTSGQPGVNVLQTLANAAPSNSGHNSGHLALHPQSQSHPISERQNLPHPRSPIPQTASSIQNVEANSKRDGQHASNVPNKRPRMDSSISISPRSKDKPKADDNLQQILSSYEDEFTCPICCDLFVASHVGNPCGHNVCGDCGLRWHQNTENKNKGCPCCRGTLDAVTPMIPNISMDNTVEKHVQALALSGMREWGPSGQKYKDWSARKKAWRDAAKKREKTKTKTSQWNRSIVSLGAIRVFDAPEEWFHPEDNLEEEPAREEDSDVELIPRPVRMRRRRGRRPV